MSNPEKGVDWFARRKLGLFLHFGLYAIEGWHEQDQMRRRIPRAEYAKLARRFNPAAFDADRLLDLAESVGMEYVCLTAKHHDGFCLWDTKQTDFNILRTPYGKDLVGQLAEACHRRGFPLGLYYSVVDWHHPGYPNQGRHHELACPEAGDQPDWNCYLDYLRSQVRELCTNYGEIRHFFWDMNVPGFRDPSVNQMLRALQPNMVINDRGFDDGDFGTPEREFNCGDTDRRLRFDRSTEACNSVGTQSWGYRKDEDYYTSAFLIRSIDEMMAKGAHYLLNIGPDAAGRVPDAAAKILAEVGAWYRRTRESFGDAESASELTSNRQVLLTRRGNTLYVHLRTPVSSEAVVLAPIGLQPRSAVLLNTGETLRCSTEVLPIHWQNGDRVLTVKGLPQDFLGRGETPVLRLEFESPLAADTRVVQAFTE